jgi:molybdenum cofactor cytidylyltransferase
MEGESRPAAAMAAAVQIEIRVVSVVMNWIPSPHMSTPETGLPLRPRRVVAIVLAAGQGRRFAEANPGAGPKLLAEVDGIPMAERAIRMLRGGGVTEVVAVRAAQAPESLRRVVERLADRVAVNPDPSRGMLSSVQVGLGATEGRSAVYLVMPADMPFVKAESVAAVIAAAATGRTVSPRYRGRGGHPVALSTRVCTLVAESNPFGSLKPLIYADDPLLLDVDDPGILRDVDVPADLGA